MADDKTQGDIITELMGLDDTALQTKLGFNDKVKQFRDDMARANKLTGKGRQLVLDRLRDMFAPQSYALSDLGYTLSRAEEKENPSKTSPQSIVDCCCGD